VSGYLDQSLFNQLTNLLKCLTAHWNQLYLKNLQPLILPNSSMGESYLEIEHPASSSHRSLSEAERAQVGIHEGLVRLSAGIEDFEDLRADLEGAFRALEG
jgi:cystathionine beta-lyase/cystathionine gamma-synthase